MPKTINSKLTLRKLTEDDDYQVIYLTKKFINESKNNHLGFDRQKIEELFHTIVDNDSFFVYGLANEDNDIVGMLIAFIAPCFFSNKTQTAEMAWYVLPQYRGQKESFDLVLEYEKWAQEKGASVINMIALKELDYSKIDKAYTKLGYKHVESTYIKEL